MFWNPETFIWWKNLSAPPGLFYAQQLWNRNLLKPLLLMSFYCTKIISIFFIFFYKNYIRWILKLFFLIFLFFSRLPKISWYCTLTHDDWEMKQTGKTNDPNIWLQNNILSWVPTEKWFAHDNITTSKIEINIKHIGRTEKALYI